ncbi:hypothetical protein [Defluviimonas salinarum]|uniref:Uncharacterized protein n=1 Tax=Defluviimonas salinarum TaxID=2992147 RepID=A0ABT3J480_9RHOB|nr:hypothetical protein [Defluviimonas salinarum]MCW3782495.1 hypothetical protein [Defluviimonas salinarum]
MIGADCEKSLRKIVFLVFRRLAYDRYRRNPEPGAMGNRTEMELARIGDMLAGQVRTDPHGSRRFPDGSDIADPLSWAAQTRRALGERVRICGFWCFENPKAAGIAEIRERHDFAVIDGRWVVDGWARLFGPDDTPGVVDMADPETRRRAVAFYGDPSLWERDTDMEVRVDGLGSARPAVHTLPLPPEAPAQGAF